MAETPEVKELLDFVERLHRSTKSNLEVFKAHRNVQPCVGTREQWIRNTQDQIDTIQDLLARHGRKLAQPFPG